MIISVSVCFKRQPTNSVTSVRNFITDSNRFPGSSTSFSFLSFVFKCFFVCALRLVTEITAKFFNTLLNRRDSVTGFLAVPLQPAQTRLNIWVKPNSSCFPVLFRYYFNHRGNWRFFKGAGESNNDNKTFFKERHKKRLHSVNGVKVSRIIVF